MTDASTRIAARPSCSRLRTCLALASISVCGLAALIWTFFAQPLPRLVYNPSDSAAVGWYRVEALHHHADSPPPSWFVGDIILTRLPPRWSRSAVICQRIFHCSNVSARSHRNTFASWLVTSISTACRLLPCYPPTG